MKAKVAIIKMTIKRDNGNEIVDEFSNLGKAIEYLKSIKEDENSAKGGIIIEENRNHEIITVGNLIRYLRRSAKLTLGDVSDKLNTSVSNVSKLEHWRLGLEKCYKELK